VSRRPSAPHLCLRERKPHTFGLRVLSLMPTLSQRTKFCCTGPRLSLECSMFLLGRSQFTTFHAWKHVWAHTSREMTPVHGTQEVHTTERPTDFFQDLADSSAHVTEPIEFCHSQLALLANYARRAGPSTLPRQDETITGKLNWVHWSMCKWSYNYRSCIWLQLMLAKASEP
jgi:hypothetical protein